MKSSHPADARSAPTHYAPSVPMTVYRELAAELRANQAVIDSLNSRNQQLLQQNQMLKQEIHNVVQATLSLGQVAGVARQAAGNGQGGSVNFPSAIAPDTLAKLVRNDAQPEVAVPMPPQMPPQNRVPRAIASQPAQQQSIQQQSIQQQSARTPKAPSNPEGRRTTGKDMAQELAREAAKDRAREQAKEQAREQARDMARQIPNRQRQAAAPQQRQQQAFKAVETQSKQIKPPAKQKLFTEQPSGYRSSALDSSENKEIGGIWLVLSIILIIVTAFGAGFLIMKPLLNDR